METVLKRRMNEGRSTGNRRQKLAQQSSWKLTERLVTGIELWKLYFQIRTCCALTSASDKIAGTKKLQANTFFGSQTIFFQEDR
jgi:hypothetical protein